MAYPQGASYSDVDRTLLRQQILGQEHSPETYSESLYGVDQYFQDFTPYDTTSLFATGNDPWGLDYQYNQFNGAESMFPEDSFNTDVASSDTSKAPSLYDEPYVQSPTSPTFSSAMSVCSGSMSLAMSPEMVMSPEMHLLDSSTPSPQDYKEETMSEQAESVSSPESDIVLDNLLEATAPASDGRFYCSDVPSEDHSCEFVAERKCMLRKHLETNLKMNICRHPGCGQTAFSSKAVLTRHEKETHGMHSAHQYYCPVPTCERSQRPFPREYNMGDHINRVHRELDVNDYLKKSKRPRKPSAGATGNPVMTAMAVKRGGARGKREKLERQYRTSRENIGKVYYKMMEQNTLDVHKYIVQMKTELMRLEDAATALGASND